MDGIPGSLSTIRRPCPSWILTVLFRSLTSDGYAEGIYYQ